MWYCIYTQDAFDKAPFVNWTVDGRVAGRVKSGGGLTFIEVEGAGHMVPYNQPLVVRLSFSFTLSLCVGYDIVLRMRRSWYRSIYNQVD